MLPQAWQLLIANYQFYLNQVWQKQFLRFPGSETGAVICGSRVFPIKVKFWFKLPNKSLLFLTSSLATWEIEEILAKQTFDQTSLQGSSPHRALPLADGKAAWRCRAFPSKADHTAYYHIIVQKVLILSNQAKVTRAPMLVTAYL